MSGVDDRQQMLDLKAKRPKKMVDNIYIERCRSMRQAIKLCVDLSGVNDNALCIDLGIDPGQWSRIKSGQAHFPDKFNEIQDVCGNYAPLQWYAHSEGFGLVKLQSELEAENDQLRQEKQELEAKLKNFEEFLKLGGKQ